MKYLLLASLLVFCFAGTGVAAANPAEKDVEAAVEFMRKAMISGVKTDLEKVAHPNLAYIHSNGREENRAEFVDWLVQRKSDFIEIKLLDQKVTVTDDVAIVRHVLDGLLHDDKSKGTTRTLYMRMLLVFKKTNGEWKLLARQSSPTKRPEK